MHFLGQVHNFIFFMILLSKYLNTKLYRKVESLNCRFETQKMGCGAVLIGSQLRRRLIVINKMLVQYNNFNNSLSINHRQGACTVIFVE